MAHNHPANVAAYDEITPTQRRVETFARNFGSLRFLFWQTVIITVWITVNIVGIGLRWDPYPFILLNLVFSTQAAYAAPVILLAQNRQTEHDRVRAEHDCDVNEASFAEIRKDAEVNRTALATLTELVQRVASLEQRILSGKDSP